MIKCPICNKEAKIDEDLIYHCYRCDITFIICYLKDKQVYRIL